MYDPALATAETERPAAASPAPAPSTAATAAASTTARPEAAAAPAPPAPPAPTDPATPLAPTPTAAPRLDAATPAGAGGGPGPGPGHRGRGDDPAGSEEGFSHARLALRPAELGRVEVLLKTSQYGVSASVLAETPEAAQLLEGSGAELRRRLELQGVQLLDLTVSVSVAQDAPAGTGGEGRPESGPGSARAESGATAAGDEPTQPIRTIELGGGVLVDVLA